MANPHRILIAGVGSIGERHLRCFAATDRTRVSFCEPNEQLSNQIAKRYGISQVYGDFETALESEHDAVVIATPAHLHVPMAIRAAEAGLHMLIEKPLSTTLQGVDALSEIIQERDVVAGVAYVMRAHPALAAMRREIVSGRFGRPLQLTAVCGQHFPAYRPAYRDTYYKNHATGGGAIQDALTHILNAGQWLVGPIDRLVCDADHKALEGVTVEDTVHILARHGEVMACYSLNQHQAPNESTVTVVCERGTARFEIHRQRWRWMVTPDEPWRDEPIKAFARDTLFIAQANTFLDAIERRVAPLCSLDEAAATLKCNLAALRSAKESEWQTIN